MKKFFILLFLTTLSLALQAQDDFPLYDAANAYQSSDFLKAYALFSTIDSATPITYYPDLWKYYISTEKIGNLIKAEKLLYRLVQSNGFERSDFDLDFFNDIGLKNRRYWPELDSLIQTTESRRCQAFIDSLALLAQNDQNIRQKINEQGWTDEICEQMTVIDSSNTSRLQSLIDKYGFPSWKLVGRKGSRDAWLIAQHSYWYLPIFLKEFRQSIIEDDAEKKLLAYMEDRYLMFQGLPQIYGTQLAQRDTIVGYYPIMDMKNLDKRRLTAGIESFADFALSLDMDTLFIHPDYLDYLNNYYPNNALMYASIDTHWQNKKTKKTIEWYFDQSFYGFSRDLEVLAFYFWESDSSLAVQQAKKIVLHGKRIDEEWHLPIPLMDSVKVNYSELRAEYESLMTQEGDSMLNSITSFDTLVKILNTGFYPRYTYDAWNGHIKELIANKAKTLSKNDYLAFFEWLFEQVKLGNYHLFDYAELYDIVYFKLFGKSYYGQNTFNSHVLLYNPYKVNQRRSRIHLPPIKTWQRIRKHMNNITEK